MGQNPSALLGQSSIAEPSDHQETVQLFRTGSGFRSGPRAEGFCAEDVADTGTASADGAGPEQKALKHRPSDGGAARARGTGARLRRIDGAKVSKTYHPPATPYQRLLADARTNEEVRRRATATYATLDPVQLLKTIREVSAGAG